MSPSERENLREANLSVERTLGVLIATVDNVVAKVEQGFKEAKEDRREIVTRLEATNLQVAETRHKVETMAGAVETLQTQVAPLHKEFTNDQLRQKVTSWLVRTSKWLVDLVIKGVIISTAIFGVLAARSWEEAVNVVQRFF